MTANHDEAFQLAYMKRDESNLARAYLELREVEANVRAELARSARAMPEWAHLKQYGYAPGDYMNRCHACGEVVEFVDKRAIICRPCAEAKHALATALPAVTPQVAEAATDNDLAIYQSIAENYFRDGQLVDHATARMGLIDKGEAK